MQLSSSAFSAGAVIPRRFTCDGEDLSPPLHWEAAPPATRSFVLLCDDPDAPGGTARLKQAINDFHRAGYGGPCPPHGHGNHRYHFRLLALSVEHLSLPAKPSCSEVEREARRHLVAEATLVGIYQR